MFNFIRFTQEGVIAFAEITGDKNPIHLDPEFAAKTPFGRPIVHGFLSAAVFSKVFGMLFPGQGTIYLSQEMSFRAPVFAGEKYTAEFEVIDVNTEKHIGTIKCLLLDAAGKECITGTAKLKHNKEFI